MQQFTPIKSWEVFWRSAFSTEHAGHTWTLEVNYFDENEVAHLYRDGWLEEKQKVPAVFILPDGALIEADASWYAVKHVRLRVGDAITPLEPTAGSAEKWRADMAHSFPQTSRIVNTISWIILVVAAVTQLPELVAMIARLTGLSMPFTFNLPGWLNTTLTWLGVAAAIDRALSMKYNAWID